MNKQDASPPTIIVDTREPATEAGDHPDSVFRPCVFAPGITRNMPFADRPKTALPSTRKALNCGDYSLPGLEYHVAFERKSLADLLATLFGEGENTALGERAANLDRFRAELERACVARYWLFAIVVEGEPGSLFRESKRRFAEYGKGFDPFSVLALLRSFELDLNAPTIWAGTKGLAELEVGHRLARIWSQAIGGAQSKKAHARGYDPQWLDVLKDTSHAEVELGIEPPTEAPKRFAQAGGMTSNSREFADRRNARKRAV